MHVPPEADCAAVYVCMYMYVCKCRYDCPEYVTQVDACAEADYAGLLQVCVCMYVNACMIALSM
jgi:hypothetical protein